MNSTTPYEQLIAEKLDQLPVPDMADSIWSTIEGELDAVPKPKGRGFYGIAIIVAVITALLWWYYSHKDHHPPHTAPVPVTTPAKQEPPPAEPPPGKIKKKNAPIVPTDIKKDTASSYNPPKDSVRIDSIRRDSPAVQKPSLPILDEDPSYIPLPPRGKKPKGVKGIGSDDYKITASKDSGRKKN